MKTALVFGSSGLVGGHLLSQLIENDDYNKIILRVPPPAKETVLLPPSISTAQS